MPLIQPSDRVHGSDDQVGVVYKPNCNLYNIYLKDNNGDDVDLSNVDSYGSNAQVDGLLEMLLKELNPLAWFAVSDGGNVLAVVMDKAVNDADELQTRIQNNVDGLSNTEVYEATSITFGDNS